MSLEIRDRFDLIKWGITACETPGCPGDAEALVDDREALCFECCGKLIERRNLIGEYGRQALDWFAPFGEFQDG